MQDGRHRIASLVASLTLGIAAVSCALWVVPTRLACAGPNVGESTGWCLLAWLYLVGPLLIAVVGFVAALVAPGRAGFAMWMAGVTIGLATLALLQSGAETVMAQDAVDLLPFALLPALVGFPPGSWLGDGFRRAWVRTDAGRVMPLDHEDG